MSYNNYSIGFCIKTREPRMNSRGNTFYKTSAVGSHNGYFEGSYNRIISSLFKMIVENLVGRDSLGALRAPVARRATYLVF